MASRFQRIKKKAEYWIKRHPFWVFKRFPVTVKISATMDKRKKKCPTWWVIIPSELAWSWVACASRGKRRKPAPAESILLKSICILNGFFWAI